MKTSAGLLLVQVPSFVVVSIINRLKKKNSIIWLRSGRLKYEIILSEEWEGPLGLSSIRTYIP